MRTSRLSLLLLLLPVVAWAANFDRDLYFGLRNNPDVTKLQEFLRDQGIYSGPVTGNFFSLTREAVKKFQEREGITPALGYAGLKTRARLNSSASKPAETVEEILAKIKALQAELKLLQDRQIKEQTAKAEAASPVKTQEPPPAVVAPVVPKAVNVTGTSVGIFPVIEQTDTKIGEISVKNNTDASILFANFETVLYDSMDSTVNRGRKVTFVLKDGLLSSSASISRTEFTFLSSPPKMDDPYRSPLNLPFGVTLNSGEEKKISIWVEQLLYVRAGTLRIQEIKLNSTSAADIIGSWDLSLTRAAPL